jgi:hypothetical protein
VGSGRREEKKEGERENVGGLVGRREAMSWQKIVKKV